MLVVAVVVALGVLAGLTCAHWYLWRRLVRDVSAPRSVYRRVGAVLVVVLPLTTVGAMAVGRGTGPFWLERVLAWPGFFWAALLLYLCMFLLAGEALRPLLSRTVARVAARRAAARGAPVGEAVPAAPASVGVEPTVAAVGAGGSAGASGDRAEGERPSQPGGAVAGPGEAGGDDAADAGDGRAGREAAAAGDGPSRRLFVARTVAVAAGAAATATVGLGAWSTLNGPTVKRITVPLAKLPRAGHGFRIAVVSDIHLGPILGRSHTQRIVDAINGTQPDLVAIVGDLVDGEVADLGPAARPLARLRARHGSYFVTGNHEYFGDAREWIEYVRDLGVRPLENAREELPHFDLAGVNDLAGEEEGEGPDFPKALGDRDPKRASVLLAHQPVQIHEAVRHGVDLQLSGHSHGGQLWPGPYLAELANPTVAGLERYGDTQLYVTRGAGAWGPPVRVGAESDITVVELASREA